MKLAVLFPSGHIFDTPCVPNLISYLSKKNIGIGFYSAKNTATPCGDFDCLLNVDHHVFPLEQRRTKENVFSLSVFFLFWVLKSLLGNKYDLLIAVGIRGLFITAITAKLLRCDFVYYSLEIYDDKLDAGHLYSFYKRLERIFHGWSVGTIIQDEIRAELISQINRVPFNHMMIFPNAPYHTNSKIITNQQVDLDVRKLVGNAKGRSVVLASGSLTAKWAGISGIIEASDNLPDECVLILQSRQMINHYDIQHKSSKIITSINPLSVNQYENLVCQSAIGLAWYASEDRNINFVGLSSGKIAHYLFCGKPIIVNRIPFWSDVIIECGCGVVVDDFDEIPAAVKDILSKYHVYSAGAQKAYEKYFDMDAYTQIIKSRLKAIGAR
jgi:glycosyltransferase involved in cell wall biosynthesis